MTMTNEEMVRLYQQGNKAILGRLFEDNRGIINLIANKFSTDKIVCIDRDDLIQEGFIGLTIAAAKFDENKGVRFYVYASQWIYQKMSRLINNNLSKAKEVSLYEPIAEDLTIEDTLEDKECIIRLEESIYYQELKQELEQVRRESLNLEQRQVIDYKYGFRGKTYTSNEIAQILNTDESRVNNVHRESIRRIKATRWARIRLSERRQEYLSKKSMV